MPIGLEDLEVFFAAGITPSDKTVLKRAQNWSQLFEKYSFEQTEEDGVDWDDFEKLNIGKQTEDDDIVIDDCEASEDSDCSEVEDKSKDLTNLSPEEKLSHHFSQELLNELKRIFTQRAADLGKLNLPFWNYERQETSITESVLHTPNYTAASRNIRSCQEKVSSRMNLGQDVVNKINVNGNAQGSTDIHTTLASLIAIGAGFTMKIREREYDIEVNGGDTGALSKACSGSIAAKPMSFPEVNRLASFQNPKADAKDAQFKLPRENIAESRNIRSKMTKRGNIVKYKISDVKSSKTKEVKSGNKPAKPNKIVKKPKKIASSSESSEITCEASESTSSDSKAWKKDSSSDELQSCNRPGAIKTSNTNTAQKVPDNKRTPKRAKPINVMQPSATKGNVGERNSIIISDSDDTDDDFYLPEVKKQPLVRPAAKSRQNQSSRDSSSGDDDDLFWSLKQSTNKKAPKNQFNTDENESPKKMRKFN